VTVSSISFCLLTNGRAVERTSTCIHSILKLDRPASVATECLAAGTPAPFADHPGVTPLTPGNPEDLTYLGRLRNLAAKRAQGDYLVFIDDDILFPRAWLVRFLAFAEKTNPDWAANPILLPNGDRYWDRATHTPHTMVPYDHPETDPNLYQCGCFSVIRRSLWQAHPWSDELPFYAESHGFEDNEDVEYSKRLVRAGISLRFDPANPVWHWSDDYRAVRHRGRFICRRVNQLRFREKLFSRSRHQAAFKRDVRAAEAG